MKNAFFGIVCCFHFVNFRAKIVIPFLGKGLVERELKEALKGRH
jgi:hypothetical protein